LTPYFAGVKKTYFGPKLEAVAALNLMTQEIRSATRASSQ